MKLRFLILLIFFGGPVFCQSYKEIHHKAILVDTHNDILTQTMEKGLVFDKDLSGKAHSDLKRWKQGGLDVQFFSVWSDGDQVRPFDFAVRQMDSLDAIIRRNPDKIVKAPDTREIYKAVRQRKIAAVLGVEGGHMIEDDLGKLDYFYKRGVRYMTLTWNNSTSWASSAADETYRKDIEHKGLTDFGRQVVSKMNSLGMMIDVSHVGEQTFADVMKVTRKPVIASHSSVYALCPHPRNLKDGQIKAIAENGGVVQINFYSGFIDSTYRRKADAFLARHKTENDSLLQAGVPDYMAGEILFTRYPEEVQNIRPPLAMVIEHIEYVIRLVGVDFVGIGSDFDGIESAPLQLDDVTAYPLITKALLEKGYSRQDLDKILGGNILRVLKANETRK